MTTTNTNHAEMVHRLLARAGDPVLTPAQTTQLLQTALVHAVLELADAVWSTGGLGK